VGADVSLWSFGALVWIAIAHVKLIDVSPNAPDESYPAERLQLQLEIGRVRCLEKLNARRSAEALSLPLGAEPYLAIIDSRLEADGCGCVDP
jgi:hypothetical protein